MSLPQYGYYIVDYFTGYDIHLLNPNSGINSLCCGWMAKMDEPVDLSSYMEEDLCQKCVSTYKSILEFNKRRKKDV